MMMKILTIIRKLKRYRRKLTVILVTVVTFFLAIPNVYADSGTGNPLTDALSQLFNSIMNGITGIIDTLVEAFRTIVIDPLSGWITSILEDPVLKFIAPLVIVAVIVGALILLNVGWSIGKEIKEFFED